MDYSVIVAVGALILSAVGFFYKIGQDTKGNRTHGNSKLDQISSQLETVLEKVDKIVEWQQTAHGIHESHREQLKTLFNRVENLENRMEDRETITRALQKILERME